MRNKIVFCLILSLALVGQFTFSWIPCSPILEDRAFSTDVYDTNGTLLRLTLAEDDAYRIRIPLSQISPLLVESTLLYEDEYFYRHPGINPFSLGKAVYHSFIARDQARGASTITMQLARMIYRINSKHPLGKIHQMLRALQIEFLYSKDEILEAYLNLVPYGFNIEGAGAAALIYFNKSPAQLSLLEALTLAVIPQSPTKRTKNLHQVSTVGNELKSYRQFLLGKWIQKYPQNIDESVDFDLEMTFRRPWELPFHAPHLVTQVLQHSNTPEKIETTLDLRYQQLFERIVSNYVQRQKSLGVYNAMAVLLNYKTMDVVAHLGSADFFNDDIFGQVNGPLARRSPGSSLKPFVYGLGLDQGIFHPATVLKDTPYAFGTYKPQNFDKSFAGPIPATEALYKSRNIPALTLSSKLNDPSLYEFLKGLGIPLNDDPKHYGLSIVLGSAEVTMFELVTLYAALGNGGLFQPLSVFKNKRSEVQNRILSPEASFLVLDMLSQNPFPVHAFSSKWLLRRKNIAWKTGTSWGFRDAWATGVFGDYVISVWLGNFSGKSNPAFVGRSLAGPLLFELVDGVLLESGSQALPIVADPSLNVAEVEVCSISGLLPGPNCQHKKKSLFIPGKSPIHTCEIHREIEIDIKSGLRSCLSLNRESRKETYEIWPSDMQALFKLAGMPRKLPPKFHQLCSEEDAPGNPPKITSPKQEVVYNVRYRNKNAETIPFSAIVDGDAKQLLWFVDEQFMGKTLPDESFLWKAKPGTYNIRVTDDLGRTSSTRLLVKLIE